MTTADHFHSRGSQQGAAAGVAAAKRRLVCWKSSQKRLCLELPKGETMWAEPRAGAIAALITERGSGTVQMMEVNGASKTRRKKQRQPVEDSSRSPAMTQSSAQAK